MKKIISLFLIISIIMAFSACSSGGEKETTAPKATSSGSESSSPVSENASSEKKILTIYFSSANTVDATSSATPYFDGVASTQYLAEYINSKVGGDIVKITPKTDYPEGYNETADAAKIETDSDARPEFLELEVNPEEYDVIFVGYPMWWGTYPMAIFTQLEKLDFNGKNVFPVITHEGSGLAGAPAALKKYCSGASVGAGLAVHGADSKSSKAAVEKWASNNL